MHQGFAYYIADRENKKDDFRCAAACLRKAIEAEPHCTELQYQLAQYATLSGEISDALDHLDTIVRSDPKYVVKILAEADFIGIRPQIEEMLLRYDQELSQIFVKLFNDDTDILSRLIKICSYPTIYLGFLVKPAEPYAHQHERKLTEFKGEVVGCDWEVVRNYITWYGDGWKSRPHWYGFYGYIRPQKSSILEEIDRDSKNVLSKIEEIVEIYKRGDILSKKVACDLLAEISFTSLNTIPFDIKTGKIRLKYRAGWAIWVCTNWNSPAYDTTKDIETDVYLGIGSERI
jgi:tetratricopeptide (TPR) repeat protein